MKRTLCLFGLAIFFPLTGFSQTGLKPQDLSQLQSIGEAQISPDATRVIYTVVHNDRPGAPYSQAWVMDISSGKSVRLGDDKGSAGGARWSPDGKSIAYFGSAGDKSGLVVAKGDGSSP